MKKELYVITGIIIGGAAAVTADITSRQSILLMHETIQTAEELDRLSDECSKIGNSQYIRTIQTIRERLNVNDKYFEIECRATVIEGGE